MLTGILHSGLYGTSNLLRVHAVPSLQQNSLDSCINPESMPLVTSYRAISKDLQKRW